MWHAWHFTAFGSWFTPVRVALQALRSQRAPTSRAGRGTTVQFAACLRDAVQTLRRAMSLWHDVHVGDRRSGGAGGSSCSSGASVRAASRSRPSLAWHWLQRVHHAAPKPGRRVVRRVALRALVLAADRARRPRWVAARAVLLDADVVLLVTAGCTAFCVRRAAGHFAAMRGLVLRGTSRTPRRRRRSRACAAGDTSGRRACFSFGGLNSAATLLWHFKHAAFGTPGEPWSVWHFLQSPWCGTLAVDRDPQRRRREHRAVALRARRSRCR